MDLESNKRSDVDMSFYQSPSCVYLHTANVAKLIKGTQNSNMAWSEIQFVYVLSVCFLGLLKERSILKHIKSHQLFYLFKLFMMYLAILVQVSWSVLYVYYSFVLSWGSSQSSVKG